ncbi:MAG: hypothetical protein IV084_08585 [Rugosibacter sp.]|nr:hypothetical protein [Rugosibacter sp.]
MLINSAPPEFSPSGLNESDGNNVTDNQPGQPVMHRQQEKSALVTRRCL